MTKENIDKLSALMRENPELPVVIAKSGEFDSDSGDYFLADWGRCEVVEYAVSKHNRNPIVFKQENPDINAVCSALYYLNVPEYKGNGYAYQDKYISYYEAIPWQKAIMVFIG